MAKVKFFDSTIESHLENKVNDFIREKKVISVSYTTTHEYGLTEYHCCVLYEDR